MAVSSRQRVHLDTFFFKRVHSSKVHSSPSAWYRNDSSPKQVNSLSLCVNLAIGGDTAATPLLLLWRRGTRRVSRKVCQLFGSSCHLFAAVTVVTFVVLGRLSSDINNNLFTAIAAIAASVAVVVCVSTADAAGGTPERNVADAVRGSLASQTKSGRYFFPAMMTGG